MGYAAGVSTTDQTPESTGYVNRARERYERVRRHREENAPPSILASKATDTIAAWIGEHHQAGDLIYPYGVYTQQQHPQAIPAQVTKAFKIWAERGWLAEPTSQHLHEDGNGRRYYQITRDGYTHFVAEALKLRYLSNRLDPQEDE